MVFLALLLALAQDPSKEADKLKVELAEKTARIADLQRQLDQSNTLLAKLEADVQVLVRQLEVQLAHIEDLAKTNEEVRRALAKAQNDRKVSETELALVRKAATLQAKVTAVAGEIGLVVLSAGSDDGVREGDEFTLSRDGAFVAKVVIERVDRKWSAGKVRDRKLDPRVGDEAASRGPAESEGPAALRDLRRELDELRRQIRELSERLPTGPKEHGATLEEAGDELRAHLGIARGLIVRAVREGSLAEKAGLKPGDVVPDLAAPELVEAISKDRPIRVIRRGRPLVLGER